MSYRSTKSSNINKKQNNKFLSEDEVEEEAKRCLEKGKGFSYKAVRINDQQYKEGKCVDPLSQTFSKPRSNSFFTAKKPSSTIKGGGRGTRGCTLPTRENRNSLPKTLLKQFPLSEYMIDPVTHIKLGTIYAIQPKNIQDVPYSWYDQNGNRLYTASAPNRLPESITKEERRKAKEWYENLVDTQEDPFVPEIPPKLLAERPLNGNNYKFNQNPQTGKWEFFVQSKAGTAADDFGSWRDENGKFLRSGGSWIPTSKPVPVKNTYVQEETTPKIPSILLKEYSLKEYNYRPERNSKTGKWEFFVQSKVGYAADDFGSYYDENGEFIRSGGSWIPTSKPVPVQEKEEEKEEKESLHFHIPIYQFGWKRYIVNLPQVKNKECTWRYVMDLTNPNILLRPSQEENQRPNEYEVKVKITEKKKKQNLMFICMADKKIENIYPKVIQEEEPKELIFTFHYEEEEEERE